jgi:hypothetical protein
MSCISDSKCQLSPSKKFFDWYTPTGQELWAKLYCEIAKHHDLIDSLYIENFKNPMIDNLKSNEWQTWWCDDKKSLESILATDKPWLKYPLAVLSLVENPEEYKRIRNERSKCIFETQKYYPKLLEDKKDQLAIIAKAKQPSNIEWWSWPHGCVTVNGVLLYKLFQSAFPSKAFQVVETPRHTWVVDDEGNNYDLYWPIIGMNDVPNHHGK